MEDLIRPYVANIPERRATLYSKLLGKLHLSGIWEGQGKRPQPDTAPGA